MPLVRAWMRGLSGASGAAVLVPGGILVALLLLGLAGSFGRLGGLGQAFSGPAAPGSAQVASALQGPAARGPALLPVVAAPTVAAVPAAVRAGVTAGRVTANRSPGTRHGASSSGGGVGEPVAPFPPGSTGPPGGSGGCGSCTQPPPHQTLIDQAVSIGTSLTSKLPGSVGKLATQLLQQVGATVDKILPTDRRANPVTELGSAHSKLKLP